MEAGQTTTQATEEKGLHKTDLIMLLSTIVRLAGGQVRFPIDEMNETSKGDKVFQITAEPQGFLLLEVKDEVPAKL